MRAVVVVVGALPPLLRPMGEGGDKKDKIIYLVKLTLTLTLTDEATANFVFVVLGGGPHQVR